MPSLDLFISQGAFTMTVIAYCGKTKRLIADSATVIDYGSRGQRIEGGTKKLFMSSCRRVAFASTGYKLNSIDVEALEKFIVPRIDLYLREHSDEALQISQKERDALHLAHQIIIAVTSELVFILNIGSKSFINIGDIDETLIYGNVTIHAHNALATGMPIEDAVAYAVSKCEMSRLPLSVIDMAEILPFNVAEEVENNVNN